MFSIRSFAHVVFAIVLLPFAAAPSSGQQPTARDQQIQELQKQIDALSKKLEELRHAPPVPTPPTAPDGTVSPEWLKALNWRCIGPASMGGRITAISVFENDPCTYFIGTASGGLLKTVNNGVTFEHQFDHEATVSIGDVCVAPSDRNIVWVGTGEANPRNSVSYGDGVYKSTDGGKTWKNMGLKKSFQIGRIAIHPKNPNIVYVGALGRLYGPHEERGLFKTTDGGVSWQKVLYTDDKTGVIDIRMHPSDPETLLVAMYERRRDEFDTHRGEPPPADGYDNYDPIKKWGPGSALYKTTDGGKTFRKLSKGLPTCHLGRIGLDYYRKDPNIVFAIIDTEKIGMGLAATADNVYLGVVGEDADAGMRVTQIVAGSPAAQAGIKTGDVIVKVDKKPVPSFGQLSQLVRVHKAGDKLAVDLTREGKSQEVLVTLKNQPAGTQPAGLFGGSKNRPNSFMYGGQRENLQDKQGPDSFQYGGIYKSIDGGESWTRINSLNPRPMYFSQIRVDPSDDKFLVVLGISLYRSSDGGKTFQPDGGQGVHPDQHALWIDPKDGRHMIVGCDGGFYATYDRMANWDFLNHLAIGQFYHVAVDNRKPYRVYGGLQDNGSWAGPSRSLSGTGPVNADWVLLGGGDGFACQVDAGDPDLVYWEFQDGNMFRRNLRTGEMTMLRPKALEEGPPRMNWSAPFLVPLGHLPLVPLMPTLVKPDTRYRFNWNTPLILSSHNSHIFYCAGNYVFRSLKQGSDLRPISPEITRTKRGSATVLAESPRNSDVLYVGTDDGALWVTRDGGVHWASIAEKVGLPGPRWVASIEPSRFIEGRAYVVFDAHRSDDDEPYVYVTEDYGQTWKSLRANLPSGSSRVLREDVENSSLLFLGTEFATWVSLNRGVSWTKLNNNLPTVAVHDLAIHPSAGEMVAATHGRSLWVLDITPLRQMNAEVLKEKAHLYQPNTAIRWRSEPDRDSPYGVGARRFSGQNPPPGAQIYFSLTEKPQKITLKVVDIAGKTVQEFIPKPEPGLYRVDWNLLRTGPRPVGSAPRRQFGIPPARPVDAGMYRVILTADGRELTQTLRVEPDPTVPTALFTPEGPQSNGEEERERDPDR
jgi:photosystem II stability/assembly factor-like uncharacterized protein